MAPATTSKKPTIQLINTPKKCVAHGKLLTPSIIQNRVEVVVTTEKLPPIVKYERDLASGQFQPDAAQRRAVEALQRLYDDLLVSEQHHQGGWLRRLKQRIQGAPAAPKGIYFWGGVGRGKTYLVDTF